MSEHLHQTKFDPNGIVKSATERLTAIVQGYASEIAKDIASGSYVCESPIEALMYGAFEFREKVYGNKDMYPRTFIASHLGEGPETQFDTFVRWLMAGLQIPSLPRSIFVQPQVVIRSRRVDFLCGFVGLISGQPRFLIVECDGHYFHVVNKSQAEKDRRGDRVLLSDGLPTMRFTGSEIYRDPIACVDEVRGYFAAYVKEELDAQLDNFRTRSAEGD